MNCPDCKIPCHTVEVRSPDGLVRLQKSLCPRCRWMGDYDPSNPGWGETQDIPLVSRFRLKVQTDWGVGEQGAKQWVENCPNCRIPMVKLRDVKRGQFIPIADTMSIGECKNDLAAKEKLLTMLADPGFDWQYRPQWYCGTCDTLWGEVLSYWAAWQEREVQVQNLTG